MSELAVALTTGGRDERFEFGLDVLLDGLVAKSQGESGQTLSFPRSAGLTGVPTTGPHEVAFAISGPIARADLPGLCERVCSDPPRRAAAVARCDVSGVEPDAVCVDALARLQLAARRRGCRVRLENASPRSSAWWSSWV